MLRLKDEIAKTIAPLVEMTPEEVWSLLEIPPEKEMGDFSFPCFLLARKMRKAPPLIAGDLKEQIATEKGVYWSKVDNAGPYLNFFANYPNLGGEVIKDVLSGSYINHWGLVDNEPVVLIDYSSPNIAKPFGIGHLRSTLIGNALYRLYSSMGYRAVGMNHLGDWGTQFGKLMSAYCRWGDENEFLANPVDYSFKLYVRFHREAEENPELEDEARAWFKKLEDGQEEAGRLWEKFCSFSLDEFKRVYGILDIDFEYYRGESFYNPYLEKTLRLLKEKGVAKESQGALVVDLEEHGLPTCILCKSDGSTLYMTRDLAAAIHRYEHFKFDKMLYVVGAEQTLHFQQLFKILELLGFEWADRCRHIPFGLIRFRDGRMSTREGNVILLSEVIKRAEELARQVIEEKNPDLSDKEKTALAVGLGAIKFGDLQNDRIKNIDFDWEKVLDFSGETAPYVQYAHARICSILRKAGEISGNNEKRKGSENDREFSILSSVPGFMEAEEEKALLKELALVPETVRLSVETDKPSHLARRLVDLAREFNRFYHNCPVLGTEDLKLRETRLALIGAVRNVLAEGLELLGIVALKEM